MVKEDIKKVKDQGKLFERLSADYDIGKFLFPIFLFLIDFTLLFSFTKECRCIKN